jgi:hypothetical protein
MVTMTATSLLPKDNLSKKEVEGVAFFPDDREPFPAGERLQRIETSSVLPIGMNVGVIEDAANLVPFPPEDPKRVDRTRGATNMEQYFQGRSTNRIPGERVSL